MPMDRKLYPKDWDAIARRVKRDAGWHCEHCARPCLLPGEDWLDFLIRLGVTVGEARVLKRGQFILTTAHLDHVPENCERTNLKAWCAPCHCRNDLRHMGTKKRLKLERAGQMLLGGGSSLVSPGPAGLGRDLSRIQLALEVWGC